MDETNRNNFFSTASIYNNFFGTKSQGKIENTLTFRAEFSKYDVNKHTIVAGTNCKWDKNNCAGIPLDFDESKQIVYCDGSDAHTILIGSTGSKKSRLVVMPTVHILASAGESMIICDPKAEIYKRTSGMLESNDYKVNVVNLREPEKGDSWNLLSIPYKLFKAGEIDKACAFINDATVNLIPLNSKDPYWDYSARDLLFGLILLVFEFCKHHNIQDDSVNISAVLKLRKELFSSTSTEKIKKNKIWLYAEKFDLVISRLIGIIICPSNTMACILSTFDQHMSCFLMQPQIIDLLSSTSIDVDNIGFKKRAIYLIMPDEKSTFHKLITVFVKQIYELLIDTSYKKCEDGKFPTRINFILDEFSSLPTISDFPQMITASRSRNIRFVLVAQSKHQLKERYGEEAETIQSNCTNWLFLTSREIELLREISALSGDKNREPLISVSKLQHLNKDKGECLVFSGRLYPYFARLADIEKYDNNFYEEIKMETRKRYLFKEWSFSDLINFEENSINQQNI